MRKRKTLVLLMFSISLLLVGCTPSNSDNKSNDLETIVENFEVVKEVEGDFELAKTFEEASISWTTQSNYFVIEEGNEAYNVSVTRPNKTIGDVNEIMKAEFTLDEKTLEKEYSIKILNDGSVTCKDFYSFGDGEKVSVIGTVYAKALEDQKGFYINDSTGNIFVYGAESDVKMNQKVRIDGNKKNFYQIQQLVYESNSQITVLDEDVEPTVKYEKSTVSGILKDYNSTSTLAKTYNIDAKVVMKKVDFETFVYLEDLINGEQIQIYKASASDQVALFVNKYINLNLTTYTYNDAKKEFQVFVGKEGNQIKEINPTYSDDEKFQAIKISLDEEYKGKEFYNDIELITNYDIFDATITWKSSNVNVLSDDGKIVNVSTKTDVILTASIAINDKVEQHQISVVVAPAPVEKIQNIISNFTTSRICAFEGIVTGTRGTSGYFIEDHGYSLYVKGNYNGMNTGDILRIIGTVSYSGGQLVVEANSEIKIEGDYVISNPKELTVEEVCALPEKDPTMGSLISLDGEIVAKKGSYGNSYFFSSLLDESKSISIHAASNTAFLSYISGRPIKLTCYLQNYDSRAHNWTLFVANRDGEVTSLESNELKVSVGEQYLNDIMPVENEKITTDIALPTIHPAFGDISYTWSSNNENILTNEGKHVNVGNDEKVVLSLKISAGEEVLSKNYSYDIIAKDSNYANDLMFTSLLHGATNDKMYTIFNNTGKEVNLNEYTVISIQNTGIGSNSYSVDASNIAGKLKLEGTLKQGETMVFHHVSCKKELVNQIKAGTKVISSPNQNGVVSFNGKDGDTIVLQRNTVIVDQIGSFEKLPSQGAQASYEKEYFGSKMLIRKNALENRPTMDWSNFDLVNSIWDKYSAPIAPDYTLPEIFYDYGSAI